MEDDRLSLISRVLDDAFVNAVEESLDVLRLRFDSACNAILGVGEFEEVELLEINRGVEERLLVGAIQRKRLPRECLEILDAREILGFEDPIREWQIKHVLIQYLLSYDANCYRQFANEMIAGVVDKLTICEEACRESLDQAKALLEENGAGSN